MYAPWLKNNIDSLSFRKCQTVPLLPLGEQAQSGGKEYFVTILSSSEWPLQVSWNKRDGNDSRNFNSVYNIQ